jgi:hypothetical protein
VVLSPMFMVGSGFGDAHETWDVRSFDLDWWMPYQVRVRHKLEKS